MTLILKVYKLQVFVSGRIWHPRSIVLCSLNRLHDGGTGKEDHGTDIF